MQWHLRSWQNARHKQKVDYPDKEALTHSVDELSKLPPLVSVTEINQLKQQLKEAMQGKRFILQAGDCAESFDNCKASSINQRLKILQQMGLILTHGLEKPVSTIGRIAGQYAKPRTTAFETKNDVTLPSYRGDLINDRAFSKEARTPDPERLLKGYSYASTTLNYIRSLNPTIFRDLEQTSHWPLEDFANHPPLKEKLTDVIKAVKLLQIQQETKPETLFTSHEALHLDYESALTRQRDKKWFNLSTHFPWLGMRTASADSAHLEYLRGIENPLAIKVGPDINIKELLDVIRCLNPHKEEGKITLINRFGVDKVQHCLPDVIEGIQRSKEPVLWSCDPMHGNSFTTASGLKSRRLTDIQKELTLSKQIHDDMESNLGAIHLEISGNNITECIGGIQQLNEVSLETNYRSLLDPRLNRSQAIETSFYLNSLLTRNHQQLKLVK